MHRYSGLDATGEDGEAEQLSPSQSRASSRGRPLPGCQGAAAAVPHRSGLAAAAAAPAARYASGPPGLSRPWPPAGGKPAAPRHQKGITGLAGGRRAPPDCAGLGLEKAQKRRECGQRSGCARNALGVEEQGGGSARYQRLNSPQLRRMGGRGAGCKGAGRATCVAAAAGGAEPRSAAPLHPRSQKGAQSLLPYHSRAPDTFLFPARPAPGPPAEGWAARCSRKSRGTGGAGGRQRELGSARRFSATITAPAGVGARLRLGLGATAGAARSEHPGLARARALARRSRVLPLPPGGLLPPPSSSPSAAVPFPNVRAASARLPARHSARWLAPPPALPPRARSRPLIFLSKVEGVGEGAGQRPGPWLVAPGPRRSSRRAAPRAAAPLRPPREPAGRNSQRAAPGAGATAPAPRNPPAGRDSPLSGTAPHSAPLGSPGPPSIELAGLPSLRKLG
ncbi:uncharacterized protein ACOB8E_013032 [Sarcophilus harrisii]